MTIAFTEKCLVEITLSYDEATDTYDKDGEYFSKDEEVQGDIIVDYGDKVDFQFYNGSMAYGLPKKYYKVIPTMRGE
jgi:hypothetical protein